MTETLQATARPTACIIEIRLVDGDRIHACIPGGQEAARAELESVHARLGTEGFVLVGDTIVRSEDVRHIQVRDNIRGGNMGNYETTPQQQQQRGGTQRDGGLTDQWVGYGNRPWAETKPFFLTSEFLAAAALIAGILIATGMNDNLDAPRGWLYAAIVGAAYIVSRGIAKAGTRDPNPDRFGGGRNRQ
jgi:hypothetical protein